MTKNWWQSKTIWVNGITLLIALGTAAMGQDFIKDHPAIVSGIVAALGFLNVILRFVTTTAVAVKKE